MTFVNGAANPCGKAPRELEDNDLIKIHNLTFRFWYASRSAAKYRSPRKDPIFYIQKSDNVTTDFFPITYQQLIEMNSAPKRYQLNLFCVVEPNPIPASLPICVISKAELAVFKGTFLVYGFLANEWLGINKEPSIDKDDITVHCLQVHDTAIIVNQMKSKTKRGAGSLTTQNVFKEKANARTKPQEPNDENSNANQEEQRRNDLREEIDMINPMPGVQLHRRATRMNFLNRSGLINSRRSAKALVRDHVTPRSRKSEIGVSSPLARIVETNRNSDEDDDDRNASPLKNVSSGARNLSFNSYAGQQGQTRPQNLPKQKLKRSHSSPRNRSVKFISMFQILQKRVVAPLLRPKLI